jgi:dihydrofolate synthase/folylpolyglutamate synthase
MHYKNRYQKALRFIDERQHFGIKLGLHNIQALAEQLGNPQDRFLTVHVAGTNGKGSTSSFIAGILRANGYKVGLYTSPHLADYRERIRIDGQKIPPAAVVEFIETHKRALIRSQATFFELTTALAFWYFAREGIDWGVIETGLGGRLDATNIITPVVSVITNIGLEHTNILGKTIYQIAGEKGGIIKPSVPLVTGMADNGNDAARRFHELCRERQAPISFRDTREYAHQTSNGHDRIIIKRGPFAGTTASLSLAGRHQVENAILAVRAVEVIKSLGHRITRASVRRGLTSNRWPGRFMTVRSRPTVIIDVAHNPDGFLVLAETLRNRFPGRKFDFLIGMVEKKQGNRCLQIIAPLARTISVVRLQIDRADDAYYLVSDLSFGKNRVRVYPDAATAYKDLLENSADSDILIITGSHFIMGELAPYLRREGF